MENKFALSETQIEHLFAFVKKKFVNYYDLQVELVDHLASLIEADMEANPTHDFETALNKVYAGFGIFGFWNLVKERTKAAQINGRTLWWQHFKALFSWPAASVSIVIAFGIFFGLKFLGFNVMVWILGIIFFIVGISLVIESSPKRKGFVGILFSQGALGAAFMIPFQISINLSFWTNNESLSNSQWTFPVFLLFALSYLALVKVHQQLLNELKRNYPLAFT